MSQVRDQTIVDTASVSSRAPNMSPSGTSISVREANNVHVSVSAEPGSNDFSTDMVEAGVGQLPPDWYRQTPMQALTRKHGWTHLLMSTIMVFGCNVAAGYIFLSTYTSVGLFHEPEVSDYSSDPYYSTGVSDIMSTVFGVTFGTTIFGPMNLRALKKGWTVPIESSLMRGGCWRCIPVHVTRWYVRALLLALILVFFFALPMVFIIFLACEGDGFHGSGQQCQMLTTPYIFMKAGFGAFAGAVTFAITLVLTLNVDNIPSKDMVEFVSSQQERWTKQQQEQPQPAGRIVAA